MSRTSQNAAILKHLRRAPITPLEALRRYNAFRLASRIGELREAGYDIRKQMVKRGDKRFARYSLA